MAWVEAALTSVAPLRSSVRLTTQKFDGEIVLDSAGQFQMSEIDDQYVGPPSADVDEAWEKLLSGCKSLCVTFKGAREQ